MELSDRLKDVMMERKVKVKDLAALTDVPEQTIFALLTKHGKNTQAAKKVMTHTYESIKRISELSEHIKDSINGQVNSTATVSAQIANASSGAEKISEAIDEIADIGSTFKN